MSCDEWRQQGASDYIRDTPLRTVDSRHETANIPPSRPTSVSHVIVVPHNPEWVTRFGGESQRIVQQLGESLVTIHHIGSTSIPGILAKPIIDMLGIAARLHLIDTMVASMLAMGYQALGEYGIPGRRYFRKDNAAGAREYHLHIFAAGSPEIDRHLAFRDYMIAHPHEARAYSSLKQNLVERHHGDDAAYIAGKDSFVKEAQARALAWRSALVSERSADC
jgi:GrpB-like predicted nucleotidyltransferase (UPF0157 family)